MRVGTNRLWSISLWLWLFARLLEECDLRGTVSLLKTDVIPDACRDSSDGEAILGLWARICEDNIKDRDLCKNLDILSLQVVWDSSRACQDPVTAHTHSFRPASNPHSSSSLQQGAPTDDYRPLQAPRSRLATVERRNAKLQIFRGMVTSASNIKKTRSLLSSPQAPTPETRSSITSRWNRV